jgi:hypothetical protein
MFKKISERNPCLYPQQESPDIKLPWTHKDCGIQYGEK